MPLTPDPPAPSPADSPSPAVRAAHRRVERARARGQVPPEGAALSSGAAPRAPGRAGPARAGTHVVDRALAYRRHAEAGMSAVAIARRVRKSKSHVSILLRLGAALEGLETGELAALRTPAVTWRLVQRLVRGDTRVQTNAERTAAVLALRRALRDTIAGFSSHTVDRRRQRRGRTPGAPALERFDPGAFAANPAAYIAGHLDDLVAAHEATARHALRMLDRALAAERLAAVPLSALARLSRAQLAAIAERGRAHLSADQQRAVDALAAASHALQHLASVAAALRRPPAAPAGDVTLGRAASPAAATHAVPAIPFGADVTGEELEADLAD